MLSIGKIKHVIFDFDGVIIDSERQKFKDLQQILSEYKHILSDSQFPNFIGKKRGQFLIELGIKNIDEIMAKVHEIDSTYDSLELVDGLTDFLEFLHRNGVKMHIATGSSKEFVLKNLSQNNIANYFTEIITGDEITESKPNPVVYLEMKKRIGSEGVIVIEDSPAGIQAAKRAQLFVIGFGVDLESDIEFESYVSLIKYLSR